jgi:hypothetical protein
MEAVSARFTRRAAWNTISSFTATDFAFILFSFLVFSSCSEPLAKLASGYRLCQGTTSVVPQMANLDSGFSRCGIANY